MIKFKNIEIEKNINLGKLTTMRIGGDAKFLTRVRTKEDVRDAIEFAKKYKLPIFILGGGSNTIVHDEGFEGLVVKNEFTGCRILEEDKDSISFRLGSSENWDKFCQHAVKEENLSGCEAMVMIPGTVGALPVQNVGAYGQETVNIFKGCEVIDLETGKSIYLSKEQCELGYRTSIFRTHKMGKYFITSVDLILFKKPQKLNLYFSVAEYFDNNRIDKEAATPEQIMNAVIFLRKEKLPSPDDIPSAGSFFKNIELSKTEADLFLSKFPDAQVFEENGKWKVPTGWLIDNTGLKGKIIHGMRPHFKNPYNY